MSIRFTTRSHYKLRTRSAFISCARSRSAELSTLVSAFFLRTAAHSAAETALQSESRLAISTFTFSSDALYDQQCFQRFRFIKSDIHRIIHRLQWASSMNSTRRCRQCTNSIEAFCMLTRRHGTSYKWCYLEQEFGRGSSALNEIFYHTVELLLEK